MDPKQIIRIYKVTKCCRQTARQLGIAPSTVSRWKRRARSAYGKDRFSTRGLKRKSTKPRRVAYKLTSEELTRLLVARKHHGYCAQRLKRVIDSPLSARTLHRALKRHGLIKESPLHRRPRFQDTVHMHLKNAKTIGYLQMDVKYITPELSGLPWTCFEYAVIDIYSRYKEAVILNHLDQDGAILALTEILPKLPFTPVFVQTDNGLEFQQRFKSHVLGLGLKHHYVHVRSPNENAVIERSFRTDEEEFFFWLEKRPKDYDELRELFAKYLSKYNTFRPHMGINFKTPAEVVAEVVSQ